MPANVKITQNFTKLEELNKNLKTKLVTKVGILGNASGRDGGITNAEIGAKHEFGSLSEGIPRRSFLNDPLVEKRKDFVKAEAKIIADNLAEKNGIKKIFRKAGAKAEEIIQQAFATGGFGKWTPLSQKTIDQKGRSSILINTAQLRKSISSEVEEI
jgi:hypothetical protein